MPSPGVSTIQTDLESGTYDIGTLTIQFASGGESMNKMAIGMHNGWGVSRSNTPSLNMEGTIETSYGTYVKTGYGLEYIKAIGKGIDLETADWVTSYDSNSDTHSYIPTQSSIKQRILDQMTLDYPGFVYLSDKCASIFVTYATELSP